jgi:hypothetical protein
MLNPAELQRRLSQLREQIENVSAAKSEVVVKRPWRGQHHHQQAARWRGRTVGEGGNSMKCVVNRHRFQLPCTEWVRRSGSDCDGFSWLSKERVAHRFACSAVFLDRRCGNGSRDIVRPARTAYTARADDHIVRLPEKCPSRNEHGSLSSGSAAWDLAEFKAVEASLRSRAIPSNHRENFPKLGASASPSAESDAQA